MFKTKTWGADCVCERCGYSWTTYYQREPKSCAKCKSKYWNQPRVYSGKYVQATICQRTKPTGKKANLDSDSIATSAGESSD